MKITLSSLGRFHIFDLAQQLISNGVDTTLVTAYPSVKIPSKIRNCGHTKTFPYVHVPYMLCEQKKLIPRFALHRIEHIDRITLDYFCAKTIQHLDVFHGMSSSSLISGKKAKTAGAVYICDRGSSHIETQAHLLRDEFESWDIKYDGIDQRCIDQNIIERELEEYSTADAIFVPSEFSKTSFIERGIAKNKIHKIPYGVQLSDFYMDDIKSEFHFDIVFAGALSLRKGVPYLFEAFRNLQVGNKRLFLAGQHSKTIEKLLRSMNLWNDSIYPLGHLSQPDLRKLFSRCHALVLPSVEDGFGLVIGQAMACGCPVIATTNTGGPDFIIDGINGFTVPPRNPTAIMAALEKIAQDRSSHNQLSVGAINTTHAIGGWNSYTKKVLATYRELIDELH